MGKKNQGGSQSTTAAPRSSRKARKHKKRNVVEEMRNRFMLSDGLGNVSFNHDKFTAWFDKFFAKHQLMSTLPGFNVNQL